MKSVKVKLDSLSLEKLLKSRDVRVGGSKYGFVIPFTSSCMEKRVKDRFKELEVKIRVEVNT